ncbi:MAG TPA: cytochrome P450 [Burkholderiales bacterium]
MSAKPPVTDWTTDFDHTDPRWLENPYPIWDTLRAQCPVAHSTRFDGGAYFPSRFQDVRDIAYDTEHFSSRRVIVREKKLDPPMPSPPITSDPPEHRAARMPLLPAFNPKAVEKLVPASRALCNRLIDAFIDKGGCDAATEYAQHIPTRVIARMLGVDEDDGDRFRRWIRMALEEGIHDPAPAMQAIREMSVYFAGELAKRGDTPGEDLISFMRDQRVDGQPLSPENLVGTLRLILIAGIDTTWSAIGASLWHLATHDEDRRRLASEPALMDTAVEELLRAYAPVTMAREVIKDVTIGGCPMKPGAMVLLSFPAANRDPAMFPDADKVLLDRQENRHAAFGLGIHRCVGSNLARMELRVALEEWLKRIPEFRLAPGETVRWSEGTVRGPRALPVVFGNRK